MGNCIRHESPMQWGGDDWGPIFTDDLVPLPETRRHVSVPKNAAPTSGEGSKVKIKITKKQLQELLDRVELKEMTVQQVMVKLVGGGGGGGGGGASEMHHHAWQPALQSIPEAN